MTRFTSEQAHAYVEIQQLVHNWGFEIDHHHGSHIADLLTADCLYVVGGAARRGPAAVVKWYEERRQRLAATPEGLPTQRHAIMNLRALFRNAGEAAITFNIIRFSTRGNPGNLEHADPQSFGDVRMDVRRNADGHWRIAMCDGNTSFRTPRA